MLSHLDLLSTQNNYGVWLGTWILNFFLHIVNQKSECYLMNSPSFSTGRPYTLAIYQVSIQALIYFKFPFSSVSLFISPRTIHMAFIVYSYMLFIICNKYLCMVRKSPLYCVFELILVMLLAFCTSIHFIIILSSP